MHSSEHLLNWQSLIKKRKGGGGALLQVRELLSMQGTHTGMARLPDQCRSEPQFHRFREHLPTANNLRTYRGTWISASNTLG